VENGQFLYRVQIPANTTATVYVPAQNPAQVEEGGLPAESAEGVQFVKMADGCAVYEIGSGTYLFTTRGSRQGKRISNGRPIQPVTAKIPIANANGLCYTCLR
jgi:hypothetical protein